MKKNYIIIISIKNILPRLIYSKKKNKKNINCILTKNITFSKQKKKKNFSKNNSFKKSNITKLASYTKLSPLKSSNFNNRDDINSLNITPYIFKRNNYLNENQTNRFFSNEIINKLYLDYNKKNNFFLKLNSASNTRDLLLYEVKPNLTYRPSYSNKGFNCNINNLNNLKEVSFSPRKKNKKMPSKKRIKQFLSDNIKKDKYAYIYLSDNSESIKYSRRYNYNPLNV